MPKSHKYADEKTAGTRKKTANTGSIKNSENNKEVAQDEALKIQNERNKLILSIVSYAMGVGAILLFVLFVANFAGSSAWFTVICDILFGIFSWSALSVPILMIYCAVFLPKIIKRKAHIWNLILAVWLCITISVAIGIAKTGSVSSLIPTDVYTKGVSGEGAGLIGTYIGWLLVHALSTAGSWVLVIALLVAQTIFLVGLTLDDAWSFICRLAKAFWTSFISFIRKKIARHSEKKKIAKGKENEEDEDEDFLPPPPPKPGTKYLRKPVQEDNPYAEKESSPRGSSPDINPYASAEDDSDSSEDQKGVLPLPEPEVVPRPGTPAGWGEGLQGQTAPVTRLPEEDSLPRVKPKSETIRGSVDLDGIFTEKKGSNEINTPLVEEIEEKREEEVSPAGNAEIEQLAAKRVPLITVEEPDGSNEPAKTYTFPPISLLTALPSKHTDNSEELENNANRLVETLRSFKVRTKIVNVSRGPTITRYELQPEEGVRVKAIANLVDDISLNLATSGVRIEAPIPGKPAVGVEVPNKKRETVYLRSLLDNERFIQAPAKLTAAIGMDVAGDPVYVDLAKMPHLLIAGTTGSGKSVCLNCLILSILYKASPDEVKLIMIDPKKVEFNVYNGLPHLIIPVVSNNKKAAGALAWAVNEMERRYELIESVGVRDIKNYNRITANDPDKEYMPQLVIIIDELADLMMTAPTEVEESICRIAQKGRASGMHLIIGTQRPSVDVITGLIKANVPSRVAFTVSSQVDSRTIIDIAGAEKLIGRGDMLFAPIGAAKPARLQGAFVSDEEVEAVTSFIIDHSAETIYDDQVLKDIEKEAALCGSKGKKSASSDAELPLSNDDGSSDPMLKAAIDLAVESGKISTSLIQRRLSLGYGRAAKLIDEMEKKGIVSPPEGQKPRSVLISASEWNEMCMRASDTND